MTTNYARILARGATEAELIAANETPLERELMVATDSGVIKVGDGVRRYNDLPKAGGGPSSGGGTRGDDGASAYDIAVQNGFVGTQSEWVASLKGQQGNEGAVSVGYRKQNADGSYPPVGSAPSTQLLIYIGATPPNPSVVREPCLYLNGTLG